MNEPQTTFNTWMSPKFSLINLHFRYSVVAMIDIYVDQSHFRPEDTAIDQIDDEVTDEKVMKIPL